MVYPGEPWIFDDAGNKIGETGYAGGDAFDMATAWYVGDWLDSGDDNPGLVGLDWFKYMMVTGEGSGGPDCDSMFVFSTDPVPIPHPRRNLAAWFRTAGSDRYKEKKLRKLYTVRLIGYVLPALIEAWKGGEKNFRKRRGCRQRKTVLRSLLVITTH